MIDIIRLNVFDVRVVCVAADRHFSSLTGADIDMHPIELGQNCADGVSPCRHGSHAHRDSAALEFHEYLARHVM